MEQTNRNNRSHRGFSLLEMLVALSLSVIVVALAMGALAISVRDSKRESARAAMAREADFVQLILRHDLGASGVGIPRGGNINGLGTIYGGVLIAQAEATGVVGDLPRPGTNFNSVGPIAGRAANSAMAIAWTTANSGSCMPGPGCSTSDASILFPNQVGCEGSATDRTCPWGLNRVMPGDWLLIAAGDGTWTFGQASTPALGMSEINGANNGWFFDLENPYDGGTALWPYNYSGPPLSTRGLGMVSTPDRVFFKLEDRRLQRRQCWGRPVPGDNNWPVGTQNDMAAFDPASVPDASCTAWETLLGNVQALSFTYFAQDGAQVDPTSVTSESVKASISRVEWQVTTQRMVLGEAVFHQFVGAVDVRH